MRMSKTLYFNAALTEIQRGSKSRSKVPTNEQMEQAARIALRLSLRGKDFTEAQFERFLEDLVVEAIGNGILKLEAKGHPAAKRLIKKVCAA